MRPHRHRIFVGSPWPESALWTTEARLSTGSAAPLPVGPGAMCAGDCVDPGRSRVCKRARPARHYVLSSPKTGRTPRDRSDGVPGRGKTSHPWRRDLTPKRSAFCAFSAACASSRTMDIGRTAAEEWWRLCPDRQGRDRHHARHNTERRRMGPLRRGRIALARGTCPAMQATSYAWRRQPASRRI